MNNDTKMAGKDAAGRKRIMFQLHRAVAAMGHVQTLLEQAEQDELVALLRPIGVRVVNLMSAAADEAPAAEWYEADRLAVEDKWNHQLPFTSPWGARPKEPPDGK